MDGVEYRAPLHCDATFGASSVQRTGSPRPFPCTKWAQACCTRSEMAVTRSPTAPSRSPPPPGRHVPRGCCWRRRPPAASRRRGAPPAPVGKPLPRCPPRRRSPGGLGPWRAAPGVACREMEWVRVACVDDKGGTGIQPQHKACARRMLRVTQGGLRDGAGARCPGAGSVQVRPCPRSRMPPSVWHGRTQTQTRP